MTSTVERLGSITNLVHGFIYFSSEATARYRALGLTGRAQYFASRAASMGSVGPELVVATFYNFNPDVIQAVIPGAWEIAPPEVVQAARFEAAADVLHAHCDDIGEADRDRAIAIARAMVDGVGFEGKPLAAANCGLEPPSDPVVRLWQLVTIIREWRGDAHVAALRAAGVNGIEALVLHAATGQVPPSVLQGTRAWSDRAWSQAVTSLAQRGLVESDGAFTERGRAFRGDIEASTNRDAQSLIETVGESQASELCDLLKPIRNALMAAGVFAQPLGGAR